MEMGFGLLENSAASSPGNGAYCPLNGLRRIPVPGDIGVTGDTTKVDESLKGWLFLLPWLSYGSGSDELSGI